MTEFLIDDDTLMMTTPILLWFRRDLRLTDNPALRAAVGLKRPIIPVYIFSPEDEGAWVPGGASRWWLHHSLASLSADLDKRGSRLILCAGAASEVLRKLIKETGADTLVWNRLYDPSLIDRDQKIKASLKEEGLTVKSFNSALLFEPWAVQNKAGKPFQVFTPFWKHCLAATEPEAPLPAPKSLPAPVRWPSSDILESFDLLPKIHWDTGLTETWTPGERGAIRQLQVFCDEVLSGYKRNRDVPGLRGTSRMSPHLHFGEIGPRQIWDTVQAVTAQESGHGLIHGAEHYLREVGWREFAYHLLYHFPHTPEQPLREEFQDFPWRKDLKGLKAWQRGMTGYPIVDAGMRELWHTGWMHNRVRMIAASFLIKDLLIPWQEGAAWFWDTLVDADLANNTLGWQWTAGCGADAAPYFRIFNPILQGIKFDPEGVYVRRWCPELKELPDTWIHKPWEADDRVLAKAGITLGKTYPRPIVDHGEARDRALGALSEIKKS